MVLPRWQVLMTHLKMFSIWSVSIHRQGVYGEGLNLSIFLKPKPSTCMISLRLIITKRRWVVCLVNQCILGRWERLISFWTQMVNVRIYFAKWTENCNFKDRKIYKYSLAANGSSLTTNDYYHWLSQHILVPENLNKNSLKELDFIVKSYFLLTPTSYRKDKKW